MVCKYKWENSILKGQQFLPHRPSLQDYCSSWVVDFTLLSASELINPPELLNNYQKMHHADFLLVFWHLHTGTITAAAWASQAAGPEGTWDGRGPYPVFCCLVTATLTSLGCHGDTCNTKYHLMRTLKPFAPEKKSCGNAALKKWVILLLSSRNCAF